MVRTRRDGGCAHRWTRDSEFLSVVRSTADGLRETCGALWMLIPTQTGLSRYTVRLLLALSALEDWEIEALDVKTAFLYGNLDEELYMEQPEGFVVKGQERKVYKLKKAHQEIGLKKIRLDKVLKYTKYP